jgi:hypothetical protein
MDLRFLLSRRSKYITGHRIFLQAGTKWVRANEIFSHCNWKLCYYSTFHWNDWPMNFTGIFSKPPPYEQKCKQLTQLSQHATLSHAQIPDSNIFLYFSSRFSTYFLSCRKNTGPNVRYGFPCRIGPLAICCWLTGRERKRSAGHNRAHAHCPEPECMNDRSALGGAQSTRKGASEEPEFLW